MNSGTLFALMVVLPLALGWLLDLIFGDPERCPHPVVLFGRWIAAWERLGNKAVLPPAIRRRNGILTARLLVVIAFLLPLSASLPVVFLSVQRFSGRLIVPYLAIMALFVCYSLAGHTLRKEVRLVFEATDRSLVQGRRQVARIVGRDTQNLSAQEVRLAALETLAENLNDGVIAPLFYYLAGGLFGGFILMLLPDSLIGNFQLILLALLPSAFASAYKMVNTLDSMLGYRSARYLDFGRCAALQDDAWSRIPARLTAMLIIIAAARLDLFRFVMRFGREHLSPNSGYPEAALAGVLDCRFGGSHDYFGEPVYKPYIGVNDREVCVDDFYRARVVCIKSELLMLFFSLAVLSACFSFLHL